MTTMDDGRWTENMEYYDFYNSVSLEIAQCFQDGSLSYSISDAIMNDLWSSVLNNLQEGQVPQPFFQIYEAFDAGEYYRTPTKSDNPISDFTEPMIAEILAAR
jgi:hypothetical protein